MDELMSGVPKTDISDSVVPMDIKSSSTPRFDNGIGPVIVTGIEIVRSHEHLPSGEHRSVGQAR